MIKEQFLDGSATNLLARICPSNLMKLKTSRKTHRMPRSCFRLSFIPLFIYLSCFLLIICWLVFRCSCISIMSLGLSTFCLLLIVTFHNYVNLQIRSNLIVLIGFVLDPSLYSYSNCVVPLFVCFCLVFMGLH